MSELLDPLPEFPLQRRLSTTTRVFLGFLTGALFALLPMYYFYMQRDSGAQPEARSPAAEAPAPARASSGDTAEVPSRFAARMTYELSQTPDESMVPVAKGAGAPTSPEDVAYIPPPPPSPPRRAARSSDEVPTSRVVNAKPISATPPDARDTTVEIEKEALRPEYRETTRRAAEGIQPKVIEGRDIVIPPKPAGTPTRAIATSPAPPPAPPESENKRASFEGFEAAIVAERRRQEKEAAAAEGKPQVVGASPIGPPPVERAETLKVVTRNSTVTAADSGKSLGDVVDSRLAATREWLASAPQTTHTIQIMGTNSEEQLRAQLKSLSKVLDPGKVYVFRTVAQGKPAMTVVYGAYPDRQAAQQAIEKLPPAIGANKPVLRTVNGIRAELKQHGADSADATARN